MGFFDALSKIVQGKPVFEPTQTPPPAHGDPQQPMGGAGAAPSQQPAQPAVAPAGPKQQPEVEFERIVCRTEGNHMECEAEIQNNSHGQVDLDRLNFLGTSHDLGTVLRPGESREFTVFKGNRPNNTSYNRVELTVIDQNKDYWQLIFNAEFKAVGDGTYIVERIRLQQVRDI